MALSTNDILRVVVSLVLPDSVVAQNIFWVLFDNDGTSTDEDDVLDDLEDWIEGIYDNTKGSVSTAVSLDDMKVYVYDSVDDDFDEVGDRTVTTVGTSGTELLPHGVAVVTNIGTTNPDVQGRKYWAGFTEGLNDDGYIVSTAVASFALQAGDVITPFTGAATGSTFTPGVYSITRSAFFASNGEAGTNLLLGYQRRRKPGVGI